MKELFELFWIFCKIGATTFGGGYAMLPALQRELADKRGFVTNEEIMNYYAVGQCTPGVIAVNTATFVGNKRRGIPGAVAATAGIVFPSLVIIMIVAGLIQNFSGISYVQHALKGIRVAVCALILNAVISLFKSGVKDIAGFVIFSAVLLTGLFTDISPVYYIAASAVAGIIIASIAKKRKDSKSS